MRHKRSWPILIAVSVAINLLLAWQIYAASGTVDSPDTPANTYSYTLQDLHDRLDTGAVVTQTTFTEPISPTGVGTMRTLNDVMAIAPVMDNTNGATSTQVIHGRTLWGLTGGQWGVITGAGFPLVFKTGQTVSYAPGDDGDLQRGLAWSTPRFITSTTGVVTDTLTGLIWLRDANCTGGTVQWTTTFTRVIELNASGTMDGNNCGDTSNGGSHQTDWRVPNVNELTSLFYANSLSGLSNTAGTGPWSNGDPFFNFVTNGIYWSSTTWGDGISYDEAMAVVLNGRNVGLQYPLGKTGSFYVWPVRGP